VRNNFYVFRIKMQLKKKLKRLFANKQKKNLKIGIKDTRKRLPKLKL
jgi:hypothetical protein